MPFRSRRVRLGDTGVEVSRLCFGLGSSGCGSTSKQGRLPHPEVAQFVGHAVERGVTWFDTSDDYGSEPHLRAALADLARHRVQITTKSHAVDGDALEASLRGSLARLGTDYVDVFLLHEVDSLDDLARRDAALTHLERLRSGGQVRAVGLSTHNIDVLEQVAGDRRLDVLLTNFNVAGVHMDADIADYATALRRAYAARQGVAVMKTLGEGVLAARYGEALRHNLSLDFVHGVLVGVCSRHEVDAACDVWHNTCAENEDATAGTAAGR